jgi:hypothetical protein
MKEEQNEFRGLVGKPEREITRMINRDGKTILR